MSKKAIIVIVIAAAFLAAAIGGIAFVAFRSKGTTGPRVDHVSLVLNWTANGSHAAYYAAKDYGYYLEDGLDVAIHEGSGSATSVKVVAAGREEFALASASTVAIGRSKGIPVVSLAATQQKNPACLISFSKTGINGFQDLAGKKMGVRYESDTYPLYQAILRQTGLDRSKIQEISIGLGVAPLLSGDIDALDGHIDNEAVQVRERGYSINTLSYYDLGMQMYGICIVTNNNVLKDKKDLVRRFLNATMRGWKLAISDPEKTALSVTKANPSLDPKIVLAQLRATLDLAHSETAEKSGLGWQTLEGWQKTIQTLREVGQIDTSPNAAEIFTNDFITSPATLTSAVTSQNKRE